MQKKTKIISSVALVMVVAGLAWWGIGSDSTTVTPETVSPLVTGNTTLGEASLTHVLPNFTVSYPKETSVTSFEDGEGETILLRNAGSEIQFYLVPFDEDIVLTPERIKKDIPDLAVNSPVQIEIGKAVSGVYFKTPKEGLGESQEVWFVKDGYLYQLSALNTHPKAFADLVASFTFN